MAPKSVTLARHRFRRSIPVFSGGTGAPGRGEPDCYAVAAGPGKHWVNKLSSVESLSLASAIGTLVQIGVLAILKQKSLVQQTPSPETR